MLKMNKIVVYLRVNPDFHLRRRAPEHFTELENSPIILLAFLLSVLTSTSLFLVFSYI